MRRGEGDCRQKGIKMGRGRSKAGGGAVGGALGGALGGAVPRATVPSAVPPKVTPGQPVPAVTAQQLQAMSDQEFANYLNGLKSTPIDTNTYYNNKWDTQRLVANMPELNRAPQIMDPASFAKLPGETLYRTVNAGGGQSAVDICGRTMTSDVTTIGEGRMGDGFYFATSKSMSQMGYGNYRNNIQKTATMQVKLNSTAKVVTESQLNNMFSYESRVVKAAINNMRSGGSWTKSGLMAYAVRKGYNVVRSSSIVNIIDRNAATWSGEIVPMS